jgi:hypothetical protein
VKLYDFSHYARQRAATQAAREVIGAVLDIERPGSVVVLKKKIAVWLDCRKELHRAA